MAKIYKINGETEDVTPKNRKSFSLEELQSFVGGYIEMVYLKDKKIMIVNEEGKLNGLPANVKATEIFDENFPDSFDVIVGDVLITEKKYIK
jgi:hypothetical protein